MSASIAPCNSNCATRFATAVTKCCDAENLMFVFRPLQHSATLEFIHGLTCPHIPTATYVEHVKRFSKRFGGVPKSLEGISKQRNVKEAWHHFKFGSNPNERMPQEVRASAQEKVACFLTNLGKTFHMSAKRLLIDTAGMESFHYDAEQGQRWYSTTQILVNNLRTTGAAGSLYGFASANPKFRKMLKRRMDTAADESDSDSDPEESEDEDAFSCETESDDSASDSESDSSDDERFVDDSDEESVSSDDSSHSRKRQRTSHSSFKSVN